MTTVNRLTVTPRRRLLAALLLSCGALHVSSAFGQTRDWRYWPFSSNSPWNMPIGSGATYAPITAPYWQNVAAGINVTNATVSVILSVATDPVWDLYDNTLVTFQGDPPYNNSIWYYNHTPPKVPLQGFQQSTFCNPIYQSDATAFLSTSVFPDPNNINSFPFLTNPWAVVTQTVNSVTTGYTPTFHMPYGSCGSPDSDGLMSVIEEDTNLGVDFYAPIVVPNQPPGYTSKMVIAHAIGSYYDLKYGDGTGVWNGRRASLIPTLAGVIRYGEPYSSTEIPHALAVVVAQSVMNNAAVWPAAGYDTSNQYGNCGTSCLPMGALLAIPATTNLSTLGITSQEGMAMARAAQKYGVYIVDTAVDPQQSPAVFFLAQLNNPNPGLAAMTSQNTPSYNDIETIVKNLSQVTNNSAQNPGGPGTHSPMAPPFSN